MLTTHKLELLRVLWLTSGLASMVAALLGKKRKRLAGLAEHLRVVLLMELLVEEWITMDPSTPFRFASMRDVLA